MDHTFFFPKINANVHQIKHPHHKDIGQNDPLTLPSFWCPPWAFRRALIPKQHTKLLLFQKILHRLGCLKCSVYPSIKAFSGNPSIKTFSGILNGAGFFHQPYHMVGEYDICFIMEHGKRENTNCFSYIDWAVLARMCQVSRKPT